MRNNNLISIELQGLDALKQTIGAMLGRCQNIRPLLVEISETMRHEVEDNFQAGGRNPKWPESQRVKKHGGQTLINRGQLVASLQTFVTASSAGVSTNKQYAAIHNFGGSITRHPFSSSVRLRTDAKGNLLRQSTSANLAVFAKSSHKRATTKRYTSSGWTITMPQPEFMKLSDAGMEKINQAAAAFITG